MFLLHLHAGLFYAHPAKLINALHAELVSAQRIRLVLTQNNLSLKSKSNYEYGNTRRKTCGITSNSS